MSKLAELEQALPPADKTVQVGKDTLEFRRGEDVPELLAVLLAECERRNNANPNLQRINHNTWVKSSSRL